MEIDSYSKIIQKSGEEFISENLKSVIDQLQNNKAEINSNFSEINIKNIKSKSWGIYAFYIKPKKEITTFENLTNLWETNYLGKKLVSPKTIKSRFKILLSEKSHCLYIGKSENLVHRIEQHIHQKTKESTYGLKLSEHDRLHSENTFEFSFIVLKENPKQDIDTLKHLLFLLEKKLRNELSPLIGKQ